MARCHDLSRLVGSHDDGRTCFLLPVHDSRLPGRGGYMVGHPTPGNAFTLGSPCLMLRRARPQEPSGRIDVRSCVRAHVHACRQGWPEVCARVKRRRVVCVALCKPPASLAACPLSLPAVLAKILGNYADVAHVTIPPHKSHAFTLAHPRAHTWAPPPVPASPWHCSSLAYPIVTLPVACG